MLTTQYVAGLFDGEGYVTIRRVNKYKTSTPSYTCGVGIANKHLGVLKLIQAQFGGKIYPKSRKSPKHSVAFEWFTCQSSSVHRFLSDISSIVVIKSEQVRLGLDFLSLGKMKKVVVGRRRIHTTKGGTYPICNVADGEVELREDFKLRLTAMNMRGPWQGAA